MDFNSFNDDYIARNPNDFRYQSEPSPWIENLKFNVQTALDNIGENVQTSIDNITDNVRTVYENYKQNIHTIDDPYGNMNPNLQLGLNQPIEPLNIRFDNVEPLQLGLNPPMTETSIIHEELAEKESRIRQLESNEIKTTDKISQLEAEKLEDRKKIKRLDKEIKKIKENPFLKWLERAIEDSKKERTI